MQNIQSIGNSPKESVANYRQGIEDFLQRRFDQLKSGEQFVFFTFREDAQRDIFVSWPVSAYHHLPGRIIARDDRVIQAGNRLKQRYHIKAISVVGPIRTYDQYFPWIKARYEV